MIAIHHPLTIGLHDGFYFFKFWLRFLKWHRITEHYEFFTEAIIDLCCNALLIQLIVSFSWHHLTSDVDNRHKYVCSLMQSDFWNNLLVWTKELIASKLQLQSRWIDSNRHSNATVNSFIACEILVLSKSYHFRISHIIDRR